MIKKGIYAGLLLALFSSCNINQKDVKPEDGFTKIFNHPEETLAFYPESVCALPNGDYLFISAVKDELSEIEYPYTNLVHCNSRGEVVWSMDYDWLSPASRMIQMGSAVGFVAMDAQLNAYAILVDPADGNITATHDLGITSPLYAYVDQRGDLLVLGYDFISRSSWIAKYNSRFGLERSNKLPANEDLQLVIQRHLNKTGQQFPFFIGEFEGTAGPGYFVSCFHNYTLLTNFLDAAALGHTGDVFSFQTVEGISSMVYKTGSSFGLTGFYEGNNYVVPQAELDVNASQNVRDFEHIQLYELSDRASVVATELQGKKGTYTLFASQTNDNSLVIYQYEADSDSLLMTHHRGFDERVELADLLPTEDGGSIALGSIYILGRYRRPMLVKEPALTYEPEED